MIFFTCRVFNSMLKRKSNGYGYGYILGPSPVPPIYLTGSFGLVRPAWISTRAQPCLKMWRAGSPDLPAQRPRRALSRTRSPRARRE